MRQPYYDFEIAEICKWLKKHRLSMHVTLAGEISFRKLPEKKNGPSVRN